MVTVPACLKCNKSFEKDDVLFAMATCGESYMDHPQALRAWELSLWPMIMRSPALRSMLASNMGTGPVRTSAGIYLPDSCAIGYPKDRMNRVVGRFVRGLLWEHYKRTINTDTEMSVYRNPLIPPELAEFINTHTNHSWIGDDIFRYRHALVPDGTDTSLWALQFYAHSKYFVVVMGKSFKEAEGKEAEASRSRAIVSPIS